MGHEFIGVVEETGSDVATVQGRRLRHRAVRLLRTTPASSAATACRPPAAHGGFWDAGGIGGGQAEAVRVPLADGTLVKVPVGEDSALLPSLLTLSDVYGTGYHAAVHGRRERRGRPSR